MYPPADYIIHVMFYQTITLKKLSKKQSPLDFVMDVQDLVHRLSNIREALFHTTPPSGFPTSKIDTIRVATTNIDE